MNPENNNYYGNNYNMQNGGVNNSYSQMPNQGQGYNNQQNNYANPYLSYKHFSEDSNYADPTPPPPPVEILSEDNEKKGISSLASSLVGGTPQNNNVSPQNVNNFQNQGYNNQQYMYPPNNGMYNPYYQQNMGYNQNQQYPNPNMYPNSNPSNPNNNQNNSN